MKKISAGFVMGLFAMAVGLGSGRAEVRDESPPWDLAGAPLGAAGIQASLAGFSDDSLKQAARELRDEPSVVFQGKAELRDGAGPETIARVPRWDESLPAPTLAVIQPKSDTTLADAEPAVPVDAISGAVAPAAVASGSVSDRARLGAEVALRSQRELASCQHGEPGAGDVQQAVQVALQVTDGGAVTSLHIYGAASTLEACVASRAERWRFPWVDGTAVDASATLVFLPRR